MLLKIAFGRSIAEHNPKATETVRHDDRIKKRFTKKKTPRKGHNKKKSIDAWRNGTYLEVRGMLCRIDRIINK